MIGYGRDKFLELMAKNGLMVTPKRSYNKPGTDSSATKHPAINLKKDIKVSRINEVIESDMTCIRVKHQYYPLALCIDVYSRKIIGWNFSRNWTTEQTLKALQDATVNEMTDFKESIHHSDRGAQYSSQEYAEYCKARNIKQSMSRKARPTDAAHIERVNNTLKNEFNLKRTFHSFEEAEEEILWAITRYNNIRPHWSLGLKTPSEVYESGR